MRYPATLLYVLAVFALMGCGQYRVASLPFVSIRGVDAEQLSVGRWKVDAAPIHYSYTMPDTEENEGRMISFTDMAEPDDLQVVIDAAASAQGEDCMGLKDVNIVYKWMLIPLLGDCYWYKVDGIPVRKR